MCTVLNAFWHLHKRWCPSVGPPVHRSVTRKLNFWKMLFLGKFWAKEHQENETMPLEGLFRDEYANRSPERISAQCTLLHLFFPIRGIYITVFRHLYLTVSLAVGVANLCNAHMWTMNHLSGFFLRRFFFKIARKRIMSLGNNEIFAESFILTVNLT